MESSHADTLELKWMVVISTWYARHGTRSTGCTREAGHYRGHYTLEHKVHLDIILPYLCWLIQLVGGAQV